MLPHQRHKSERGSVMILTAFVIVALIGVLALVIDAGRLLSMRNEIQSSLDGGSLAGTIYFRDINLFGEDGAAYRYSQSKVAVLALLKETRLDAIDAVARDSLQNETFFFNDTSCIQTPRDFPGHEQTCGKAGNMTIEVIRGIQCFDDSTGSQKKFFCSTDRDDGKQAAWRRANAVKATLHAGDVTLFFATVFGLNSTGITAESISYLPLISCNNASLQQCDTPGSDGVSFNVNTDCEPINA